MNQRPHFNSPQFAKYVLATGVGLFPRAPGTWGSLLGLLLVFLTHWNAWLYAGTGLALGLIGALAYPASKDPHPDPHYVVIDEVCGMFVTFMAIPLTWGTALAGFILFRVFDVLKPFPVRLLERIPRFGGILADDVGAGLFAWIVLFLVFR
ncbi:MAG: phosphatidylglycerophosphatase A [Candidatus Omnitrophica bacterium]|nr:phosphatidylglycerophosphatase A [Candidatus Omnitrophota bacterium]